MADLLEPEPDQSPLLPECKFITESKRPKDTPASRYGRVIFCYNALEKSYYLYESKASLQLLDAMCRRNQISKSVIFTLLQSLAESFGTGHKRPPLSERKSLAYKQSMKILYMALICFGIYVLLVFFEIYQFPGSRLANIGVVFGYFGLFFCAVVVCGKGKKKVSFATKSRQTIFIDSYHRHEVFELLNEKNKELKNMEFTLGDNGTWIELQDVEG